MTLSVVLSAVMAFGVSMTSAAVYLGRADETDWNTAQNDRCRAFDGAQQGKLATFSNIHDYNAIKSIRNAFGNHFGNAWIGMQEQDNGQWRMVDGGSDYCSDCRGIDKWNPGEPNNQDRERCAEIYWNGNLNNNVCSEQRNYICEWQEDLIRVVSKADRMFVAVREYVNWHDARAMCQDFGGDLATWSSEDDYWAIQQAQKLAVSATWVGMSDLNTEGKWEMVDGDTHHCKNGNCNDLEIGEWNPGEPNNHGAGREDCVEMYDSGTLNNNRCNEQKRYFICEFSTGTHKWASSASLPQAVCASADPVEVPQHFVIGTYSAQNLMVVALAVFLVINAVTLAVFCLRAKGTATVRYYSKVVADSDEDSRLNA